MGVGHSNWGAAPLTTEGLAGGRCGRGSALLQWQSGLSAWENFEIASAKSCILMDLRNRDMKKYRNH